MSDDLRELVAGVISTFPPHNAYHPAQCLGMADAVLAAIEPLVVERAALVEEGDATDAPSWFSADEAHGWACGFNNAIRHLRGES